MGLVLGGLLFYSIHPISNDVSVFVLYYSIPNFTILVFPHVLSVFVIFFYVPHFPNLVFPHIFVTTRKSECSMTILFPIFPFSDIFSSIRESHYTKAIWFPVLNVSLILGVDVFIAKFSQLNTRRSFPQIKSFPFMIISKQRRRKKKEGEDYE